MKRVLANLVLFFTFSGLLSSLVAAQTPADNLVVTQWVCPSEQGEFKAKVVLPVRNGTVALSDTQVRLYGDQGRVLRGKTDSEGNVVIPGVVPGVYGMVAHGQGVFACYAMHVLDRDQGADCPEVAEIACAPVRFKQVKSTTAPYIVSKLGQKLPSIEGIRFTGQAANQDAGEVLPSPNDGVLRGRLLTSPSGFAPEMNVFILQDGFSVARQMSDINGRFAIEGLKPGVYALLAVGKQGLAAVGFSIPEEVRLESVNLTTTLGETLVVQDEGDSAGSGLEINIYVAPLDEEQIDEDSDEGDDEPTEDDFGNPLASEEPPLDGFGTPLPGGGGGFAPGGGGAGGGGFGGGGGLGALAATAGIAGVVAATTDDDNNVIIASPITPN